MNSGRGAFTFRIGFAVSGAILVVAGATLTASGREGLSLALGSIAGLLALASGASFSSWRLAAGLGAVSLLLILVLSQVDPGHADLPIEVPGLVLLAAGGVLGAIVYRSLTGAVDKQQAEVVALNATLGLKHRAFVAATSDLNGTQPGDTAAITAAIAASVGADLACCYLTSADGRRFVPQPPGIGVDRLRPQAVNRSHDRNGGPLLSAVEARNPFAAADESPLTELISFLPEDLHLKGLIAVPMPIGDHVGGFMVLGRSVAQFTDDDRRLATTLATRAGEQVASAQLVALTRQESARYSLMNELVKEASGKTMNEVLELVLGRGSEVIRYDAGRALLFQPDNTYFVLDGNAPAPEPTDGPLARVRDGETMLRNLVTEDEGIYSGLHPERFGGTVNEALTPIRGKSGVIGALCVGRRGNAGFTQLDISALDDLGSMAGVAVENSRILQVVSGQASRLDTALDALGEVSAALTTVTQGSRVLEQKTLEAAIRIVDGTAGMLTRTDSQGHQASIMAVWLSTDPAGTVFQNGQGVVGATMLSGRATVVGDLAWQADLASPPDLTGLQAAICTPMFEEGQLWGTLSVFDDKKREWTTDDQRVLATLANQGVVAVRNAELYEKNERSIWELRNLQEALQAATSTLDLNQVLQQVLAGAAKASSAQIGCLALGDDNGKLILKGGFGTDHVTAERLALVIGGEICSRVMESGQAVMEAMSPKAADDTALNPRAVLCVPITLRGKPLGVVFLANYKAGHEFTEDHRNLVTELGTQAAVAIDNARLFQDREAVILESLEALATTVDEKDRYTAGHSERVTQYALVIARQMHYAPHDAAAWTRLERGGRLHDIGKVGVPDAVIQKTGKLTDAEFEQMKSHTTRGYNILSKLHMLTDELVIVRSHHERYDGKGYPDRKTGDELPIFAWIVSAADAIDAMTSDRPYRKGMSLEVAIDQVRQGAGTHFHPDVAEAVLDAVETGQLKLIPQVSLYKDAPKIGAFENPVS